MGKLQRINSHRQCSGYNLRHRQSRRKRPSIEGIDSSQSLRKIRRAARSQKDVQFVSLTSLPILVLIRLLKFLDVRSLENLSSCCSLFDQLIAGQYLTSISLPFPMDFLNELKSVELLEKKPLLRLECKNRFESFGGVVSGYPKNIMEYIIKSQLTLLDLSMLREIDLVPEVTSVDNRDMNALLNFDAELIVQISKLKPYNNGYFNGITRLNIMMDEKAIIVPSLVRLMPNLIELGLHINTKKNLDLGTYLNDYITNLQRTVELSRAPILKLTFSSETKRDIGKELTNNVVEKLEIQGPCTLRIMPVMSNLREVIVKPQSLPDRNNGYMCTFWKSRTDDRNIHRVGLCCVNIGTTFKRCPKLVRYTGIELPSLTPVQNIKFSEWNLILRRKFYDNYLSAGGLMEFKEWCKLRWFTRQPHFY